jgi:hypothetical protein
MEKNKRKSVAVRTLTILLLVVGTLPLNTPSRTSSLIPTTIAGPRDWVGCWTSGEYSLYIAEDGKTVKGKIRHGDIGREDPEKIYDCKLVTHVDGTESLTGKWQSDSTYKDGDFTGVRRGTFAMTLRGEDRIQGAAHEGVDSDVIGNRGKDWEWNWVRQENSDLCRKRP